MKYDATTAAWKWTGSFFAILAAVGGLASPVAATTTTSTPSTPTTTFDGTYRPGDVLWIGHDGSSVSAFTHTPISPGGEHRDLGPLLAGHDWNNVRTLDVNRRGQVVLADIDGPVIYTTNLNGGPMRVLSGWSWVDDDPLVGEGPDIGSMTDIEFGPDGYVYLMTNSQSVAGPWSPTVMRIDPVDGMRSIAATIDAPPGDTARFAFAPDGRLYVAIGAAASVGSMVFGVDVTSGEVQMLKTPGEPYGFSITDIAISAAGDAYLLVGGGDARRLDLATGTTELLFGGAGDTHESELDVAPDGSLVRLRYGSISVAEYVAASGVYEGRTVATSLPFNRPYAMAVVPVPEPGSAVLFLSTCAVASCVALRPRFRRASRKDKEPESPSRRARSTA